MHWIAPAEKNAAMSEDQGGGECYTPASIAQLLAQVIEPYQARMSLRCAGPH